VIDHDSIDRISEPVLTEYSCLFQGLRDTIQAIPEREWTKGDRKGKVPARQACHLLLPLMRYSTSWRVKTTDRFDTAVSTFSRNVDTEDYPSQASVIEYTHEVEAVIEDWVPRLVKQTLTGKRKQHPPLGRAIYLLRHSVVHLAYLRREMYERDIPRPTY
jgi:hypothetical protein